MLRQQVHELVLPTKGRGFTNFTSEVERLVNSAGLKTGLATLHLQHTSASLLIQENADPKSAAIWSVSSPGSVQMVIPSSATPAKGMTICPPMCAPL